MTQHTPGPWTIGQKLHGFDFSIVNPKGDAEVGDWLVAGARWEANARLIAAAPQLLACLKALSNDPTNIGTGIAAALIIARAEGR